MKRSLREIAGFSSRGLGSLLAGCLLFGAAGHAQAYEFFAIAANLNNAASPQAQMDVSVDTQAAPGASLLLHFNVYGPDGVQLAEFDAGTNPNGFASSSSAPPPYDDLLQLSGGLPVLVRARTPQAAPIAAATIRQTLGKSEIAFGVPATTRADGTRLAMGRVFTMAIGDITHSATLLIANVSGGDQIADVFLGTTGGPGGGKYTNGRIPNQGMWIVDLDPADANSNVIVGASGDIIVQLVVDGGKKGTLNEGMVLPQ